MKQILFFLFTTSIAFSQIDIAQVGHLDYDQKLSDVWGYVDDSGNEYALVGLDFGSSVVDLSDPANPEDVYRTGGGISSERDIKTWGHYAYVVDNQAGEGLVIIDMSGAPESFSHTVWRNDGSVAWELAKVDNIFIDENGFAYLFAPEAADGSKISDKGAVILDLNDTPENPRIAGYVKSHPVDSKDFIHDGYVRGDTLWATKTRLDKLYVHLVKDKENPEYLGRALSLYNFAPRHVWLSDNGQYAFTTEELPGAFIEAYDVSNLSDITRVGMIQSNPCSLAVPHNIQVNGNFLVTSYFNDGITIHDITFPDNMIHLGTFDTDPSREGYGFNGAQGAYPFLPSGLLLASDINNGLFILDPDYQQASNLVIEVTSSFDDSPVNQATINVGSLDASTGNFGFFRGGLLDSGNFILTVSKPDFVTQEIDIDLMAGERTTVKVQLEPIDPFNSTIQVMDENGNPINEAIIQLNNPYHDLKFTTDANGSVALSLPVPLDLEVRIGKWGYHTQIIDNQSFNINNNHLEITLKKGYQDDFSMDLGWTARGLCSRGVWERAEPIGSTYEGNIINPYEDADNSSVECYITGNSGGDDVLDNDVDGITMLLSPEFDLSDYNDPYIHFSYWYARTGVQEDTPSADDFQVRLTDYENDGEIVRFTHQNTEMYQWNTYSFKVTRNLGRPLVLVLQVNDSNPDHLLKAAFDAFSIVDSAATSIATLESFDLQLSPNPASNMVIIQTELNETFELEVFDLKGRLILKRSFSGETQIDTGNWASGSYFYVVKNETKEHSGKLVKE